MEALGFDLRAEASLTGLTEEVVKSSAIEGEHLNPKEVRSSIAGKLGLDAAGLPTPGRDVDGVVEMMLDATQCFDAPLTSERLFGWHSALFPTGRSGMRPITVGGWRKDEDGPTQVRSGPIGKERVHFQAPEAGRLTDEVKQFLSWFDASSFDTAPSFNTAPAIDPVLKAAIAHIWFVTVHPFDDGNGRIARAIADLALARADNTKERFYGMSSGIEAQRSEYYLQLESAQRGSLDITAWLAWFLQCLDFAIDDADKSLGSVLRKARLWERINRGSFGEGQVNEQQVNARQRRVINRMLNDFRGHLTTSKYAKLAKYSTDTALRDIRELLERGVVIKNEGGGRSTSYRLAEPGEVLG